MLWGNSWHFFPVVSLQKNNPVVPLTLLLHHGDGHYLPYSSPLRNLHRSNRMQSANQSKLHWSPTQSTLYITPDWPWVHESELEWTLFPFCHCDPKNCLMEFFITVGFLYMHSMWCVCGYRHYTVFRNTKITFLKPVFHRRFAFFFLNRNKTIKLVNLSVSVPTFVTFNLTRSLAKNAEIITGLHH